MAKGTTFSLETLNLLDLGKIEKAFKTEVDRVVADCKDRFMDDRPRSVVLKFSFEPSLDEGEYEVLVECEITGTIPKRRSKVYTMRLDDRTGGLLFNPDLPDDPDEETLYNAQEKADDEQRGTPPQVAGKVAAAGK